MTPNDRPFADPERERQAVAHFPLDQSPEEYAERNAHSWVCFSFDDYRYRDSALDAWVTRLGDILFQRNGAPSVVELRARFLSEDERREIARLERSEL